MGSFSSAYPKSVKRQSNHQYRYTLLGSASIKAARKMLVKVTPGVNFTNVFRAAFFPILFC